MAKGNYHFEAEGFVLSLLVLPNRELMVISWTLNTSKGHGKTIKNAANRT